jgi:hypothetical protein
MPIFGKKTGFVSMQPLSTSPDCLRELWALSGLDMAGVTLVPVMPFTS